MNERTLSENSWEEAMALLSVGEDASAQTLHGAYLQMIRKHPPDRDPEMFEKIRNAYELLRDPAIRARRVLAGPDPHMPLPELLVGQKQLRRFVGPELWLAVLKEARA